MSVCCLTNWLLYLLVKTKRLRLQIDCLTTRSEGRDDHLGVKHSEGAITPTIVRPFKVSGKEKGRRK